VDADNPAVTVSRKPSIHKPFSALAFKIINDTFVVNRRLSGFYSGEPRPAATSTNSPKANGNGWDASCACTPIDREDTLSVGAGDIAALIGIKYTTTGDTLCAEEAPILLETSIIRIRWWTCASSRPARMTGKEWGWL